MPRSKSITGTTRVLGAVALTTASVVVSGLLVAGPAHAGREDCPTSACEAVYYGIEGGTADLYVDTNEGRTHSVAYVVRNGSIAEQYEFSSSGPVAEDSPGSSPRRQLSVFSRSPGTGGIFSEHPSFESERVVADDNGYIQVAAHREPRGGQVVPEQLMMQVIDANGLPHNAAVNRFTTDSIRQTAINNFVAQAQQANTLRQRLQTQLVTTTLAGIPTVAAIAIALGSSAFGPLVLLAGVMGLVGAGINYVQTNLDLWTQYVATRNQMITAFRQVLGSHQLPNPPIAFRNAGGAEYTRAQYNNHYASIDFGGSLP